MKTKLFLLPMLSIVLLFTACSSDDDNSSNVLPQDFIFEKDKIVLELSDTHKLGYTIIPENAKYQEITWESSDPTVVEIINGEIKAVAIGEATINATIPNTHISKRCTIKVIYKELSEFKLNELKITMEQGDIYTLVPIFIPTENVNKNLIWESSNQNIAQVNQQGKITAIANGDCFVKATTEDGKEATCSITVLPIKLEAIAFENKEYQLYKDSQTKINVIFSPINADNKNLLWESSNQSVLQVNQQGEITAIAVGECIIHVTTEDKRLEATCKVTVLPIALESISFPINEYHFEEDTEHYLPLVIHPQNADNAGFIWTSDNPSIASVDKGGKVHAHTKGQTIIRVQSIDGKCTTSCNLFVEDISYFVRVSVGGHTFVNGYIIGDITVSFINNGSKSIYPTSLTIISTNDNSYTIDKNKIPVVIQPGQTAYVKYVINAYRPIFLLDYQCEDKPYSFAYMPYFPVK